MTGQSGVPGVVSFNATSAVPGPAAGVSARPRQAASAEFPAALVELRIGRILAGLTLRSPPFCLSLGKPGCATLALMGLAVDAPPAIGF
jgi:hypothetical protein